MTIQRRIAEIALAGAVAVMIAVCIRMFLFQPFPVASRSMENSVCAGDEILVFKGAYHLTRFGLRPVTRGEIVVFEGKRAEDGYFVKRIIGIPGDHIVIRDGTVTVNSIVLREPYASATTGTLTLDIPADHVFVLGDNRAVSEDSRSYGPVNITRIVGTAVLIYKPLSRFGTVQ
ncbi:MAG: signal peptidase I [Spirochaetota bacterium]